jgi:hypothetical protein
MTVAHSIAALEIDNRRIIMDTQTTFTIIGAITAVFALGFGIVVTIIKSAIENSIYRIEASMTD